MRLSDFRLELVLRQRRHDARDEEIAVCRVIGMLKLAPAALGKVPARRVLVMRTEGERSIVEQGVAGNCEGDMGPA